MNKIIELKEDQELIRETFRFWFEDKEHIRSPFPFYIQEELRGRAVSRFQEWLDGLKPKAEKEVNDTIVAEKFEEIIFEEALKLVMTEDEKITILYPFLPRLKDELIDRQDEQAVKSKVIDRRVAKEGDISYMVLKLEKTDSGECWETRIELPV